MVDSDDDYNFDSDFNWWERSTSPHLKGHLMLDMQQTRFQDDILIVCVNHLFHPHWPWKCIFVKTKATSRPEEVAWNIVKLMVVARENSRHFSTPLLVSREVASDERAPSTEYGISALVSPTQFRRKTSGGVAKCRLFSQAILVGARQKKKQKPWLLYCMFQSGVMLLRVSNMDPSLCVSATGYFRVPRALIVKERPSAQHFFWKWVLFAWERKSISVSKAEQLTSFWCRGPGNSAMAYCQWDQMVTEEARWF